MPDCSGFYRNGLPVAAVLLIFFFAGCTTTSWVIDDETARDYDSRTVVSDSVYFHQAGIPSPQNPVLELDFLQSTKAEYNEHLVSRRYIQQYRPRYGYLALGMTGMGIGLYLANTSVIDADKLSTRDRALLNSAALSIGLASYFSMKPAGEARPAGEKRQLQKTGTIVEEDTVPAELPEDAVATLTIHRGDSALVSDENLAFEENRIAVNIPQKSGLQQLDGGDTLSLDITVSYKEHQFRSRIPVSDFMQEFVVTDSSDVPVRSSPALISNNIIRHAGAVSRFPFLTDLNDGWFRILKSGEAAYIQKEKVSRIWRFAEVTESDHLVVPSDRPVFGDLEVERNLPENQRTNPDAIAVIITNGAYADPVRMLPHADRVAELAASYFRDAAGLYSDNIVILEDMSRDDILQFIDDSDSLKIGGRHLSAEESDFFFYYYGHAFTDEEDNLFLLPVDYDPGDREERYVSFEALADAIGALHTRSSLIVMDTDWSRASVFGQESSGQIRGKDQAVDELSRILTGDRENTALFWAAEPGEISGPYSGPNDRDQYPYDIFTWYFFKSIKDGFRTAGEISDYLERNVPFTSRRLHDRSQNPLFFGNRDLTLIPDPSESEDGEEEQANMESLE